MNGTPIVGKELERIRNLRSKGMSVNTISFLTGRPEQSVRRVSDDVALPMEKGWSPQSAAYRFLVEHWHWVQPKPKPKKEPVKRGLITPYYYPRMWSQLPEEERPWWYHED